jgi:hypothetical protein
MITGALAFLLILSITNFLRLTDSNIRTVEFVSVLAIGMISGLMIQQIIMIFKNKE